MNPNRRIRTNTAVWALAALAVLAAPSVALADVDIAGSPNVTITKRCPSLRYLSREAKFEIEVTNTGDGTAYDCVVTDIITGNLQFRTADSGGTRSGNTITWRIGDLAPGQTRTLTATYLCNAIGDVTNTAQVRYCAMAQASCVLQVKGIPAILLECVDDPDPTEIGGTLTYTISVTNQGSATDTNIMIKCTLPPELELIKTTGPTNSKTTDAERRTIVFEPLPSLAPKQRVQYRVQVRGVGEGDLRFRVEMDSDEIGSPVMETESSRVYR
jgi:uncharacterized repeat protein (TIGR01451 family)